MSMDLAALGVTQEQLLELVVIRLESHILNTLDGESMLHAAQRQVQTLVDERVSAFLETQVPGIIDGAITSAKILQPRARYGEADKPPITFTEYICQLGAEWLTKSVDYNGRDESGFGGNSGSKQPRIVWMIHQHLKHDIESAIKRILTDAHAILGTSIQAVVTNELKRIQAAVQVVVKS